MNRKIVKNLVLSSTIFFIISCGNNNSGYFLSDNLTPKNVNIIKSKINGALSFSEVFNQSKDYVTNLSSSQNLLDFSFDSGVTANMGIIINSDTEIIVDNNAEIYETVDNDSNVLINFYKSSVSFNSQKTPYDVIIKNINNNIVGQFSKTSKSLNCKSIICTTKKTNKLRSGLK